MKRCHRQLLRETLDGTLLCIFAITPRIVGQWNSVRAAAGNVCHVVVCIRLCVVMLANRQKLFVCKT